MREYGKQKYNTHASMQRFESSESRCVYWKKVLTEKFGAANVEQKTKYQIRVKGVLDIYPKNRRYHHLSNGTRGDFDSMKDIIELLS